MRRKRRRRLKPGPVMALLLVANVCAGLAYSPITAVTRVRVVGAAPFDRPRIESEMASLAGIPCVRIRPRTVESDILQIPEAEDADFARNILGHAELKVQYRTPVARLEGAPNELMDDHGCLYRSRQSVGGLPTLRLPADALAANLSFVNTWPSAAIAQFCLGIPKSISREDCVVEVQSRGELCLNIGQSARIVFGVATGLDDKLDRLDEELKKDPRLLSKFKELNLSAPDRPSYRPLKVEQKL